MLSDHPPLRRFAFDVPLHVRVVDARVAQRVNTQTNDVLMVNPLPMLAGRAHVIAWYDAVAGAPSVGNAERVSRLFEAALSVPIRIRLCPGADS